MQNLISNQKAFLCSCQINLIEYSELKDHLRKPMQHIIKVIKPNDEKQKPERKSLEIIDFINSSETLSDYLFWIQKLINRQIKHFTPQIMNLSEFKTSSASIQLPPIFKENLKKSKIKEITHFKYSKEQIKTQLHNFLKDKNPVIFKLMFSEENNILITGGNSGKVQVFNAETLKLIANLSYHSCFVLALDIQSKYAVSGSIDQCICLWNLRKYKLKLVFKGHENGISSLKLLKNSSFILSGSEDGSIRLWNVSKKSLVFVKKSKSALRFVSMIDKEFFFAFEKGKIVKLTHSMSLTQLKFNDVIFSVKLAEEIKILATGHPDGSIQFFDTKSLKLVNRVQAHSFLVSSICFCKHTTTFATHSMDMTLKLWSFRNFKAEMVFNYNKYSYYGIEIFKSKIFFGGVQLEMFDFRAQISMNITEISKVSNMSISIGLNLIVCGHNQVYLYSLKSLKMIKSAFLNSVIFYIAFIKSDVICGTSGGYIFLLETPCLTIKKSFNFESSAINFCLPSKDWKFFVYSKVNESKVVDMEYNKISIIHNMQISSGEITGKRFVFIDTLSDIYVQESFGNCRKILKVNGRRLYVFPFLNYVLVQGYKMKRTIINLNHKRILEIESFKQLKCRADKKNFYMPKDILILSSLIDYSI